MEATQWHSAEFEWLRSRGVRIAIDDFGTGYSSLDHLRSFRASRLKMARPFRRGYRRQSRDAIIIRAVTGLAEAVGVEVLAEGVESAEQYAFLFAAGCQFGQGYYFGEPMPVAAASLRRQARTMGEIHAGAKRLALERDADNSVTGGLENVAAISFPS